MPEYRELATGLRKQVRGEVKFDEYTQVLYATDGSIYQAQPAGVILPTSVDAVRAAVEVAAAHEVPILSRGAGSSLAGQAIGPGCVVLDFSWHMDEIRDIDADGREATVQPSVVQDDFDAALAEYDLKFVPDPASSNRTTVGGGIGNNSTGAHSVRYGITDAYTEELRVVLSNGERQNLDCLYKGSRWTPRRTGRVVVSACLTEVNDDGPNLVDILAPGAARRVLFLCCASIERAHNSSDQFR